MIRGDAWFFDRFARPYELLMPPADPEALSRGLARARRPVERLLDVGGGTGRGAVAVDVPERFVVDAARGMLRRVPRGIEPVQGDAGRLPVRDQSVDAVLVVDALHHFPDAGAAIAEAARVLRPGGVLVVRDFDRGTVRGRLVEAGEHLIGFDSEFFAGWELARRVEAAGLSADVVEPGFAYTVVGEKPGGP